jgi:YVTN family beta-propeller protein
MAGCRIRAGRGMRPGLTDGPNEADAEHAGHEARAKRVRTIRGMNHGRSVVRSSGWRGPAALGLALVSSCLLADCGSGSAAASSTTPTAYVVTGASVVNPGDSVAVVDTVASKAQTPITTGTLPTGLAVTPDGRNLLVANKGDDTVVEVDVGSGDVQKRATVGLEPDAVAVTPDGAEALVANFGDDTVTPLALPSFQVGKPIPVGRQPVAVAVSPSGNLALVSDYQDGTVTPISLPSLTVGTPVAAGTEPDALYITPNSRTALVADFQTSLVTPIDLPFLTPGAVIPVVGNPTGIAGIRSSTTVYVSAGAGVTPISLGTNRPEAPIGIGTMAECLALTPTDGSAWVCGGDGTLVHVRLASRSVISRVRVGGQPTAIAIAAERLAQ